MYVPSRSEFTALAGGANVIPVYREFLADAETPVSAYRKLAAGRGASFLLESAEGTGAVARYSFLGLEPFLTVVAGGTANPFAALREALARYVPAPVPGLPPFAGGAAGYLAYDAVRYLERLPALDRQERELPDAVFLFPEIILAFDHLRRTVQIIAVARIEGDPAMAYNRAIVRIEQTAAALFRPAVAPAGALAGGSGAGGPLDGRYRSLHRRPPLRSDTTRAQFESAVQRAREYIRQGEAFQIVLSQTLEAELGAAPLDVYRVLRAINPSPYMFFLDLGDLALAGASPEMLVRVENGVARTRPIAGTRPRGVTEEADRALAGDLLADPKERAEHVMLVDLGRNDLGRVSRPGTIEIPSFMQVERYSHVMHIVTDLRGQLQEGAGALDALAACFPAGTVSGAPKVRAMELIAELEQTPRGPYAGAVGYFGFNGAMDTCIGIRMVVMSGGTARVRAGAGIVADSDPGREYEETLNKARALLLALEKAEEVAG